MHRTHFDHARLDVLSLLIWSREFWPSVTWNLREAQRWSKRVLTFDRCRPHSVTFAFYSFINTRSKQGLINAFEHWSWELRLVQGVSLKILGSETKGNYTKKNELFFPWIQGWVLLKFETCTLSNVTGTGIIRTKFSKNISFTSQKDWV